MRLYTTIQGTVWSVMLALALTSVGACDAEQEQLEQTQAEVFELKKLLLATQYSQNQLAADLVDTEALAARCQKRLHASSGATPAGEAVRAGGAEHATAAHGGDSALTLAATAPLQ